MHRRTVYTGELPRSEDFLRAQQDTMVALGNLAAAAFGTSQVADGLALSPTIPASLNMVMGGGSVYQTQNLESSAWSILPSDSHTIVKQGVLLDPIPITFSPPSTVGYSQCFLVQVQYQDVDDTPVTLQYYNSINPLQPLFGPAGAGTQQNTRRAGAVGYQIKAGVAATTGTQAIPSPDAGWAGLWVVTLSYGQNSLSYGNVALYNGAPLISAKLPDIPGKVQARAWTFALDVGVANAIAISPAPGITSYVRGQGFEVLMATAPTGPTTININGVGNKQVVKSGATALTGGEWAAGDIVRFNYDGANFQIASSGAGAGGSSSTSTSLLTSNLTMNVPTTTYPTIQSAVLAAGKYFIPPGVYLTIAVASGYIEYLTSVTGPIYLSHPHGQRIKIVGAALSGAFPTATDVDGKTNAQTLTLLQGRFNVQVQSVGTNAWELHSGYWNQIANILTSGDGTASGGFYGALFGNWSGEVGMGSVGMLNCWFHNFGLDGVRVEQTSVLQINNVGSTFCTRAGFWCSHHSVIECNIGNFLAMYNQFGISVQNNGSVFIDSASGTIDVRRNISHGVYLIAFGNFNCLPATSVNVRNNGGYGCWAFAQSLANFPSAAVFAANTSGGIFASLVSIVTAISATYQSGTPIGGGNNGSYVYV